MDKQMEKVGVEKPMFKSKFSAGYTVFKIFATFFATSCFVVYMLPHSDILGWIGISCMSFCLIFQALLMFNALSQYKKKRGESEQLVFRTKIEVIFFICSVVVTTLLLALLVFGASLEFIDTSAYINIALMFLSALIAIGLQMEILFEAFLKAKIASNVRSI